MRLWKISESEDQWSVDRSCARNGKVTFPFKLPAIKSCPECGKGGGRGDLTPFECPTDIQLLLDEYVCRGPYPVIEYDEFAQLMTKIELHLDCKQLIPGSYFLPGYWHIPSLPEELLYWPSFSEIVIHRKLVEILHRSQIEGIEFYKVKVFRVGSLDLHVEEWPDDYMGLDVDDLLELSRPFRSDSSLVNEYFLTRVKTNLYKNITSELNVTHCEVCTAVTTDENYQLYQEFADKIRSSSAIPKRFVPSADIFSCPGVGIVISDRFKSIIESLRLKHVEFSEVAVQR